MRTVFQLTKASSDEEAFVLPDVVSLRSSVVNNGLFLREISAWGDSRQPRSGGIVEPDAQAPGEAERRSSLERTKER
jgi:hypothetical protein